MEEHVCDLQRNISRVSCCQFVRLLNDTSRIPFCVDNPNNSKNNISSIQPSPSFSTKKPRSLVSDAVVKPPPELPNYLIDLTRQIHDLFKVGENSTDPSHINELASTVLRRPVSVKKQSLVLAEAITRSELGYPRDDSSNSSVTSSLSLPLHLDDVPSVEVVVEEDRTTFIFGIFLLISVAILFSMFIVRLTRPKLSTFSFASTTYATISTPLCFASTINSSSSSSSSGTTRSFMDYRDASSLMFCRVPLSFLGIETCRRCHHHRLRRGGVDTGAAATHRQKSAQRSAGESRAGIVASSSSALLKNAGDDDCRKFVEESSKISDYRTSHSRTHRSRSVRHGNTTSASDPLMLVLLEVGRLSCGRDTRGTERPPASRRRHRSGGSRSITNGNRHSLGTPPPISLSIVSSISSGEDSTPHLARQHHHHQRPLLLPSYRQSLTMIVTPSQSLTLSTGASTMNESISSSVNVSHFSGASSSIPPPPYDELECLSSAGATGRRVSDVIEERY